MQLTPHFALSELTRTDRPGYDLEQAEGAARVLPALRALAALLEEVRTLLGDRPIVVHSGYRCPRLNAAIGGSPASQHMRGEAADWHVVGWSWSTRGPRFGPAACGGAS